MIAAICLALDEPKAKHVLRSDRLSIGRFEYSRGVASRRAPRKDREKPRATRLRGEALKRATVAAATAELNSAIIEAYERKPVEERSPLDDALRKLLAWNDKRTAKLIRQISSAATADDDRIAGIVRAGRAFVRKIDGYLASFPAEHVPGGPLPDAWVRGVRAALSPWPWLLKPRAVPTSGSALLRRNLVLLYGMEHMGPGWRGHRPTARDLALLSVIAGVPDFDAMGLVTPAQALASERRAMTEAMAAVFPAFYRTARKRTGQSKPRG